MGKDRLSLVSAHDSGDHMGKQHVFVQDEEGQIEEVTRHSEISAFRDRPEAESLLVMVNRKRVEKVREIAKKGQFVSVPGEGACHVTRIPPDRGESTNESLKIVSQ
jgi:hypothetical protein